MWFEVGDKKAVLKSSQTFRDRSAIYRKNNKLGNAGTDRDIIISAKQKKNDRTDGQILSNSLEKEKSFRSIKSDSISSGIIELGGFLNNNEVKKDRTSIPSLSDPKIFGAIASGELSSSYFTSASRDNLLKESQEDSLRIINAQYEVVSDSLLRMNENCYINSQKDAKQSRHDTIDNGYSRTFNRDDDDDFLNNHITSMNDFTGDNTEEAIKKYIHQRLQSLSEEKGVENTSCDICEYLEQLKSDLADFPLEFAPHYHIKKLSSGEFSDPELMNQIFDDVVDSVYNITNMATIQEETPVKKEQGQKVLQEIKHDHPTHTYTEDRIDSSSKQSNCCSSSLHKNEICKSGDCSTKSSSFADKTPKIHSLNITSPLTKLNIASSKSPPPSRHRKRASGDFSQNDFFNSIYDYCDGCKLCDGKGCDGDGNMIGEFNKKKERKENKKPIKHYHRRTRSNPILKGVGASAISVMNPTQPTKRNCITFTSSLSDKLI